MTYTVKGLAPAIGQIVLVRFEEVKITCEIVDVKNSWNKVRVLVAPVNGVGTQWIELGRIIPEHSPVKAINTKQIGV